MDKHPVSKQKWHREGAYCHAGLQLSGHLRSLRMSLGDGMGADPVDYCSFKWFLSCNTTCSEQKSPCLPLSEHVHWNEIQWAGQTLDTWPEALRMKLQN